MKLPASRKEIQRIQSEFKTNTQIQTICPATKALIRDVHYAH